MKAMAVTSYGEPLELIDAPEPEVPTGSALLEVLACGVCATDVKTVRGTMPFSERLRLPHIPGHELVGQVVRTEPAGLLGAGSRGIVYQYWSCGRCPSCRRGSEALCSDLQGWMGFTDHGGFRERIAVPVERFIPVPDDIDAIHAAPMSCALGTAYRAVATRGGVRPGMRVALVGLGGVGIHAAQVAIAAGGSVIGFDLHQPTLEAARELGIDARRADDPRATDAIRGQTGGEGVDVAIDTVASEASLTLTQDLVRKGGRLVAVGHSPMTSLSIRTQRLVLDEIEIVGSRYAHRSEIEAAISLVAEGRIRVVVGMAAPLEAANAVIEALESGSLVGRGVLDVAAG